MCEGRRREPRARPCAVFPPACHTEGTFGIVEGPETLVKLELLNAETAALLASRRLHPTQRFAKRADGTAVLNSGTPDLQSSQSVLNQCQPTSAEPKVRIVRTVRVCRTVRMHRGAGHVSNPHIAAPLGCRGQSSTQPRGVCVSLTLSLAKLGPETGTRAGRTAAVLIRFLLRGDGNEASPQPSPKACRTIQVHPHEARRPPSGVVATGIPFPLARYALSLVGKMRLPIASHRVKLSHQAPPRHGRPQGRDRGRPGRTEQVPVASDPAPNQESAAIAHAAESAADVSAWEPDALASDPTEQGCTRRADDRDVSEPHEIIGIGRRGHGTILLPESAPSTRG